MAAVGSCSRGNAAFQAALGAVPNCSKNLSSFCVRDQLARACGAFLRGSARGLGQRSLYERCVLFAVETNEPQRGPVSRTQKLTNSCCNLALRREQPEWRCCLATAYRPRPSRWTKPKPGATAWDLAPAPRSAHTPAGPGAYQRRPAAARARRAAHSLSTRPGVGDGDHATTRLAGARRRSPTTARRRAAACSTSAPARACLSFVAVKVAPRRAVGPPTIDIAAIQAAQTNARSRALESKRASCTAPRASRRLRSRRHQHRAPPLLQVLTSCPPGARRAPEAARHRFLTSQLSEVTNAVKSAGFVPHSRQARGGLELLTAVI